MPPPARPSSGRTPPAPVVVVLPDGEPGLRTDALVTLVGWLADATEVSPTVVWWQGGPAVGPVRGSARVIDAGSVNDELLPRALAAVRLVPLARRLKSLRLRRLLAPLSNADTVLLGSPSVRSFLDWVPEAGRRRLVVWCDPDEIAEERHRGLPSGAVLVTAGPTDPSATTVEVRAVGEVGEVGDEGHGPTVLVLHPDRVARALDLAVDPGRAGAPLTIVDRPPPPAERVDLVPAVTAPVEAAVPAAPEAEPEPSPPSPATPTSPTSPAPPADPLAATLVRIWAELLDRPEVPTDADFFDLGGHSLLAARMLVLLELRTGVRLPMSVFLEATTVDELVAVARSEDIDRDPVLVPLVAGDPSRPPLFVLHDLQGSAFRFLALAEGGVDPDRPAYGFESPFLEGRRAFTSIEAMAERYVQAARSVQADGPYHLVGYSFGGILAFEMACALRADGQPVELLGIVDVGPGYRGLDYSRTDAPPLPYLEAARRAPGPLPAWARPVRRLWTRPRVLSWRWERRLARGRVVRPAERLWFAWWSHWHLVGPQWVPAPYDGRIDLFWAETTIGTDATMGWGATGAEVAVHPVPGRHEDLMRPPSLDDIAAGLRARLGTTATAP